MDDLTLYHYRRFRTGYTYREVSDMLWSYDDDPTTWHPANAKRNRRRHSVLGKWREIKLEMWERALAECGGIEGYIRWQRQQHL